jgi:hypothetical protein
MRLSKTPPFSTLKKSPFREDINVEKGELWTLIHHAL